MRTHILIAAAVLMLSTTAYAGDVRSLSLQPANSVEAPVALSLEQLAAQGSQQAAVQPAAPAPVAQQPVAQQPVAQQAQPTPDQQAAQQQAMQQQQMQQQQMRQQKLMQQKMAQQKMMQQKMMQEQMARNMSVEQKLAYKVHEVKTKVKMKLVQVLFR